MNPEPQRKEREKRSCELGVNIDHVATLRQARGYDYPDLLRAAREAERAGADQITVHLREDRRHIQDHDLPRLCGGIATRLNLEMALLDEMIEKALSLKPYSVCLVPEKREELTTEGGLDILKKEKEITELYERLQGGSKLSLFIEADPETVSCAARCGAWAVEFHTGHYCDALEKKDQKTAENQIQKIREAAAQAAELGLKVHAGHGLHLENLKPILEIPQITELNIGHALICESVFLGLDKTVCLYKEKIRSLREA